MKGLYPLDKCQNTYRNRDSSDRVTHLLCRAEWTLREALYFWNKEKSIEEPRFIICEQMMKGWEWAPIRYDERWTHRYTNRKEALPEKRWVWLKVIDPCDLELPEAKDCRTFEPPKSKDHRTIKLPNGIDCRVIELPKSQYSRDHQLLDCMMNISLLIDAAEALLEGKDTDYGHLHLAGICIQITDFLMEIHTTIDLTYLDGVSRQIGRSKGGRARKKLATKEQEDWLKEALECYRGSKYRCQRIADYIFNTHGLKVTPKTVRARLVELNLWANA